MIDQTSDRALRMARRRRLSRVRRDSAQARRALRRGLARFGFHGVVMAVGLSVAASAWTGPRVGSQLRDRAADVVEVADGVLEELLEEAQESLAELVEQTPMGEPLKPLLRTVAEGDTIRAIAEEYSVSIATVLASNNLADPDMITPGQELLIPPIEGMVAEVEPGETLARLAERVGAEPIDIAQANALPVDPELAIPYERLIVPGLEQAERAAAAPRRTQAPVVAQTDAEPVNLSKLSALTYEIQEGDTIAQLSTQFGVSIPTILQANNLANPDSLKPGTTLKVLPVNGVEHEVRAGETLQAIAEHYEVDLGPLVDFNAIDDVTNLTVGARLTVPGTERMPPSASLAAAPAPAPAIVARPAAPPVAQAPARPANTAAATAPAPARAATAQQPRSGQAVAEAPRPVSRAMLSQGAPRVQDNQQAAAPPKPEAVAAAPPKPQTAQAQAASKPQTTAQSQSASKPVAPPEVAAAAKPQAPAVAQTQPQNRLTAAAVGPAAAIPGAGSTGGVLATAMRHLGARYVFGGTSPGGFDCSGFVWYVHNAIGKPISRGLWGQMNGGPRVAKDSLVPGDSVFFANTYMPGLSHAGIYIGGGRFIHAADQRSGVTISNLNDGYWGPRFIGASRLW